MIRFESCHVTILFRTSVAFFYIFIHFDVFDVILKNFCHIVDKFTRVCYNTHVIYLIFV